MDTIKEQWLPIQGCKGYSVSNLGRVKRSGFMTRYNNGDVEYGEDAFVPTHITSSGVAVTIKSRPYLVHRLVAKAFVDPENERDYVKFLDGDKTNCRADNLTFVSVSETLKEAIANGSRSNPNPYQGIKVRCIETGEVYPSIKAVVEATNTPRWAVTRRMKDKLDINGLHYETIRK